MTLMRAIKLTEVGTVREVEVDRPRLQHGEILVQVTAAGVCKTDVSVRSADRALVPLGTTLGHEIAGVVAEVADDVEGTTVGDAVVVYPVWACGVCVMCVDGRQNACRSTGGRLRVPSAPGMSHDGGMAEFVAVPARWTVSAHDVDPALAAVLPDAGLVPYHAVSTQLHLLRPGSTAVVVGVGGLGQFAVAILRAITPARIIAVDASPRSLEAVGGRVDLAVNSTDPDAVTRILDATGGHGAELVLDFVGADATLALDGRVVARTARSACPGWAVACSSSRPRSSPASFRSGRRWRAPTAAPSVISSSSSSWPAPDAWMSTSCAIRSATPCKPWMISPAATCVAARC